jgi:hypothetical protein
VGEPHDWMVDRRTLPIGRWPIATLGGLYNASSGRQPKESLEQAVIRELREELDRAARTATIRRCMT